MDEKIAHDALQENHHTEAIKTITRNRLFYLVILLGWVRSVLSIDDSSWNVCFITANREKKTYHRSQ